MRQTKKYDGTFMPDNVKARPAFGFLCFVIRTDRLVWRVLLDMVLSICIFSEQAERIIKIEKFKCVTIKNF